MTPDIFDMIREPIAEHIQFGFVTMFSMLWSLMPVICYLFNVVKYRADAWRLGFACRRPFPRRRPSRRRRCLPDHGPAPPSPWPEPDA